MADAPSDPAAAAAASGEAAHVELLRAVAALTATRDRDEFAARLASLLHRLLAPDRVTVCHVVDHLRERHVQRRARVHRDGEVEGPQAPDPQSMPVLAQVEHWNDCVTRGAPVRLDTDVGSASPTWRHVYALPASGEVQDFVEIQTCGGRGPLSPGQEELAQALFALAGNHLAALDYGEHDTLTGLPNRKTFDAGFARMLGAAGGDVAYAHAEQGAADGGNWFALVDIDGFKAINERHGQLFGDEVLLKLARVLKRSLRASDRIFRYGGDEFALILSRTQPADAAHAFERVRKAVQDFVLPQVGSVTVSLGYTGILAGDVPSLALERADEALRYAKEHGRNLSCWHEALQRIGRLGARAQRAEADLF